jgi:hypothetical protein
MNFTIWRLHKNQVLFASAALAVITAFLLISGIHLAGEYHQALSTCGATHSCSNLGAELFQGDSWLWDLATLSMAVPGLFGIFWGAPLVAKEVEEGTHKLAWTQSVPRRRWLGANLGWALLAAALWGAAIAALLTWWLGPYNALHVNRFQPMHFEIQGIVPVAYSVFAVSLGIGAGAWFRRVLPAAAVTVGGLVVVRFVIQHFARPHYLAPLTYAFPLGGNAYGPGGGPGGGAWILSFGRITDAAGHSISFPLTLSEIPAACRAGTLASTSVKCLAQQGWLRIVTYQPAGRFWTFQGIEAALFLVLAGILVALAVWRVLTADA